MAQQYDPNLPASGQTTFGELYGILRNKFEALRTSFSGTSFPLNPVAGQVCFREDRKKWYIYVNDTSIGENGWVEIAIASAGLGAEVINARGSKSSLDERLDVSLNEDGTLKANVAAYQSEWIKPSLTFTYVDSTSFKVEGNQTDIYAPYRRLKINHSTSATGYTHVVSATYDDTNDETTVTVADAVIQSDLVSVEHSIIHSDRSKDSLPRNILDKATYDSDYDGKVENADYADSANYADSAGNADTVDNFHASQTPTANTIPVADSNGYINDWINQGEGSGLNADLLRGLPADFTCSKNQNGYTKLPNGLIIQWGNVIFDKDSLQVNDYNLIEITFPIAFPNRCLRALTNMHGYGYADSYMCTYSEGYNTDGMKVGMALNKIPPYDLIVNWIAIGY